MILRTPKACLPVRVFVGADDSQAPAVRALEYSIRKYSSLPVEFRSMTHVPVPHPKHSKNFPRTKFSFQRFLIPALTGHKGRAIYLDADMQVFSDIRELWEMPFEGHKILCTAQSDVPAAWRGNPHFNPGKQMSVLLMDCSALDWNIESVIEGLNRGRYSYEDLLYRLCLEPEAAVGAMIPGEWNSLEKYEPGLTKLVHYTVVETQPWRSGLNPLVHLWESLFTEMVMGQKIAYPELREWFEKGYLRASLVKRIADAASLRPKEAAKLKAAGLRGTFYKHARRILKGAGILA